jgi:aromatic ring-opening dioxygenase catalytic subunit (LigB family)
MTIIARGTLSRPNHADDGFADWLHRRIEDGDIASLAQYRALAPHVFRHHPTGDDLPSLFLALGATPSGARWQPLRFEGRDIGLACGS